MEGEAQRGDWKKEKRWARRGQIPRPGCRWVTCVDDVPCLVAEILGKEPVEDPSGAAPAGLRGVYRRSFTAQATAADGASRDRTASSSRSPSRKARFCRGRCHPGSAAA